MTRDARHIAAARRFSVAPMMDWTDRHCRAFHRRLTRHALLYTEMVTAAAITRGDAARLLAFDDSEHPVAAQLGGADPDELARAARIAAKIGYDEVNLNIGCPSDRVQSGRFGACLMAEPALVGDCVAAMAAAVAVPVTVKCRLGIDDQDTGAPLDRFVETVRAAGADAVIVHARKAWLKGLSPKENRDVPPLDHGRVHRLKADHPDIPVILNGGLATLDAAERQLAHVDGVMLGRAAYQGPGLLAGVDRCIFGDTATAPTPAEAVAALRPYLARELESGTPLHHLTRPMLGLFSGVPGARTWRRILGEDARRTGAGLDIVDRALAAVDTTGARQAA